VHDIFELILWIASSPSAPRIDAVIATPSEARGKQSSGHTKEGADEAEIITL
jgi:hypothetical protein